MVQHRDGAYYGSTHYGSTYLLRLYLLWQIYVALYTKTTQLNNAVHILAHS